MNKLLLTGVALIVAWSSAYTPALAETAKKTRSTALRTAACKADCLPDNLHGLYKSYHTTDPKLVSEDGRKQYSECVRKCLAPLPWFYVQRPILEAGGSWFGKSAADCLDCHVKGQNLRVP